MTGVKAVIFPVLDIDAFSPITQSVPEYLLPLANKPILEYWIEQLVTGGIKDIVVVVKHLPYDTERYFEDGGRWGASISYALIREFAGLGDALGRIPGIGEGTLICLPGNWIMEPALGRLLEVHQQTGGVLTLFDHQGQGEFVDLLRKGEAGTGYRTAPFVLAAKEVPALASSGTCRDLNDTVSYFLDLEKPPSCCRIRCCYGEMNNLADYWGLNLRLLRGEFRDVIIRGRQTGDRIWIGRNTRVHSTAVLKPPLHIGDNSLIGEGAVVGGGTVLGDTVIVDSYAVVDESVVLSNTYVGSNTEVKGAVVRKNFMMKAREGLKVFLADNVVLGDLEKEYVTRNSRRVFNLVLGFLLLSLFSPVLGGLFLCALLAGRREKFGSEERFRHLETIDLEGNLRPKPFHLFVCRTSNRLFQRLPGLINVIRGDINLVGNAPLTSEEVQSLREDWCTLRFYAPIGLFHIWDAEGAKDITFDEKLVMENYYAGTHSMKYDVIILLRSLRSLLI
jgi:NDP-sugar pyrophosphorylase family protein